MDHALFFFELFLIGIGVGLISGALGLGGGILMVPAFLAFVPGLDAHTAKGTSLFIIIFVSIINAWRLDKNFLNHPWALAGLLALGSIFGSYGAAFVTARMSEDTVLVLFMLLIAVLAIRTFFLKDRPVLEDDVHRRNGLALSIGLVAGIVGGGTGTGGGAVLIPLALMMGLTTNREAVGLSNTVMIATSLAGSLAHLRAAEIYPQTWVVGHVYFALVPLVFIGAQVGSPVGKWINHRLTLERRRVAMGVMLLLITGQLLYRLFQ